VTARAPHSRDAIDTEIHSWKFGVIEFRTQGAGLFFASDKLKARIMALPLADAVAASRDAWTQKRRADREADRHSNVTLHGCGPYDRAAHAAHVADEIRKITWQRMREGS
jgi:hypothetical protein